MFELQVIQMSVLFLQNTHDCKAKQFWLHVIFLLMYMLFEQSIW